MPMQGKAASMHNAGITKSTLHMHASSEEECTDATCTPPSLEQLRLIYYFMSCERST